jgi:MoxR-like ATPase
MIDTERVQSFPFYDGKPREECAAVPARLESVALVRERDGTHYVADAGLVDAINVALLLGQPLLLTGEPGTGKTEVAFSIGCELGYKTYKYETKSNSTAKELFYTYDALGRFHAAQLADQQKGDGPQESRVEGRDYISYNALGLAILYSNEFSAVESLLPRKFAPWPRPVRSVVLIDEIDKAPRDFPNDLLNELEQLYFNIPELSLTFEKIRANGELRPIVVITSNSEQGLPDAFLRRCIYYDIPFPDEGRLTDIVLGHARSLRVEGRPWLGEAIKFFLGLRALNPELEKKPSTAELLNWLAYLGKRASDADSLRANPALLRASLGTLFKTAADRAKADGILDGWLKGQR